MTKKSMGLAGMVMGALSCMAHAQDSHVSVTPGFYDAITNNLVFKVIADVSKPIKSMNLTYTITPQNGEPIGDDVDLSKYIGEKNVMHPYIFHDIDESARYCVAANVVTEKKEIIANQSCFSYKIKI